MNPQLKCLKHPDKICYNKVITVKYEELQACTASFKKVCEE